MLFSICSLLMLNIVVGLSGVEDYHHLFGSSSRDEVVEIAGYGEEKLSTVLITGSLHCGANNHHPHAWPIPGIYIIRDINLLRASQKFQLIYVCVIIN
jgi:hypothetical protein